MHTEIFDPVGIQIQNFLMTRQITRPLDPCVEEQKTPQNWQLIVAQSKSLSRNHLSHRSIHA